MTISAKTFACAIAISLIIFACNNASDEQMDSALPSSSSGESISSSSDNGSYNPDDIAMIETTMETDVKDWMEEQLAAGGDERRMLFILDIYSERRDLSIPGIIWEDFPYWIASLTAEELSELADNYKGLGISFSEPGKEIELPPYNPDVVIIEQEVKDWMEEQLAVDSEERRLVIIHDMYDILNSGKRDLPIPGILDSDWDSGWKTEITAEELSWLIENYKGFSIYFPWLIVNG